jgi:fido (protein-threonine AMPylation protein)
MCPCVIHEFMQGNGTELQIFFTLLNASESLDSRSFRSVPGEMAVEPHYERSSVVTTAVLKVEDCEESLILSRN